MNVLENDFVSKKERRQAVWMAFAANGRAKELPIVSKFQVLKQFPFH